MALFGKKTAEGAEKKGMDPARATPGAEGSGAPATTEPAPGDSGRYSPGKAVRFFEHARTMHEATNYEYAMQSWLNGLRLDPTNMAGMEGFFGSAAAFLGGESRKGLSKDFLRAFGSAKDDVERFLASLLQWSMKPLDAALAVRSADSASKLGLNAQTLWIAERALGAVGREKRPRKDLYLKLREIFVNLGTFDLALRAADGAMRLDPQDSKLQNEIRNLAAQATMSTGGYERAGETGGFRANIRDSDKQRRLDEQDRIVKTDETIDRLLRSAEEEFEQKPDDPVAITAYAKRLQERGRPEDEAKAYKVLNDAFEKTKQFRFRQGAGDIKLKIARRKVGEYRDTAEFAPGDAGAAENYRKAQAAFAKLELEEYKARADAYPTDLGLKYELGKRYFHAGRYEEAIALFQDAQHDARNRAGILGYLAQSFQKIDWIDEAVDTYRRALEVHTAHNDDAGMELRYGLLTALQAKAEKVRELAFAEEADKLASSIAMQQISYKDVRARRDAIKKLIAEIRSGA